MRIINGHRHINGRSLGEYGACHGCHAMGEFDVKWPIWIGIGVLAYLWFRR